MNSSLSFGKRPREDDYHPAAATELRGALNTSIEVAKTLGKVGTDVWATMKSHLNESAEVLSEYRIKTKKLESQLIERSVENSQSTLTSLSLAKDLRRSFTVSKLLSEHLQSCSSDATSIVTSHIEDSIKETLNLAQSQVEVERKEKDALVEKVSSLVSSTSNSMLQNNKDLLDARFALIQSKLAYCRMKVKYEAEKEKVLNASQEIQLLMRMTRFLAEKSKTMEVTNKELSRAKAHIRRLEYQLDLPDVIKAISAPFCGSVGSKDADIPPGQEGTDVGAPEYTIFQELQRQDITLSDLVHSWCMQHQQLKHAENHEKVLNDTFLGLQRQVLMVHHQYLEEKQRREMHERRLCELSRERLTSHVDQAIMNEMNDLRLKYSEALDDKAELKVSLCVASNALEESKRIVQSLEQKIRQMTLDAEGDHVSQTLLELRRMYHNKVEELEKRLEATETQKVVYVLHSEASAALMERCRDSFQKLQNNIVTLSGILSKNQIDSEEGFGMPVNTFSIETKKNVEDLRQTLTELHKLHSRIDTTNKNSLTMHLRVVGEMHNAVEEIKKSTVELASTANEASRQVSSCSSTTEPAAVERVMGLIEIMEKIVQESLSFIVSKLEKTEIDQSRLLSRSLDDAQRVRSLTSALQCLAEERSTLRRQFEKSTNLIQKNHITIIERAEMQDTTVEDSLEAAEAAEQLSTLRIELDAVRKAFAAAQSELKASQSLQIRLEDQMHREILEKQLMAAEIADLKVALNDSRSNESIAVNRHTDLEGRLKEMASIFQSSGDDIINSSGTSHPSSDEMDVLHNSFRQHLDRVAETVRQAINHSHSIQDQEKTKESDLLYKGYAHVVTILRETCEKLGLLKNAGEGLKNKINEGIVQAAKEGDLSSSDLKVLLLQQRLEEQERNFVQETEELKGQLNSTKDQLLTSQALANRLMQICKTLSEEKKKNGVNTASSPTSGVDKETTEDDSVVGQEKCSVDSQEDKQMSVVESEDKQICAVESEDACALESDKSLAKQQQDDDDK